MLSRDIDIMLEGKSRRQKQFVLAYGVGVNDCNFPVTSRVNGVLVTHRAFQTWKNILQRCLYAPTKQKYPTYADCSLGDEWIYFSNFHTWWKANFREGWVVDKDILFLGNKVYSPEYCLYVPEELNNFVISREAKRGGTAIGTTFDARVGLFRASISLGKGKKHHLGAHKTEDEAYSAWLNAKLKLAERFKPVCDEIHPQLYESLLTKIRSIK
ncbi:AP2 domain-containing protein [Kluyvera sp. SCKS090646]|uniref:AP2 domain-containing protein n=1 Tax=Kluyvera sichuanensis TaxID=2725494 RepID=A0ABR6RZL9_9ENTR|nr:AP2 domain-containing protein [Kluyvera sichuanensis]MBC1188495.1 AP2 domain-containing protein [Kluyvera sichuanensis]